MQDHVNVHRSPLYPPMLGMTWGVGGPFTFGKVSNGAKSIAVGVSAKTQSWFVSQIEGYRLWGLYLHDSYISRHVFSLSLICRC